MLFLTPKHNSVNVLLIFNALAISLPPSVPMLLFYFDFSRNTKLCCSVTSSHPQM